MDLSVEVIPAIDLRGGKCVRLYQGDYSRETIFSDDPLDVALRWQSMGARRLHLVDLDGAASGESGNLGVVERIVGELKIPVQLGGGIRSLASVKRILGVGVERVILGTGAVENQELVRMACCEGKENIIVGIDVRDGCVATHGWRKGTNIVAAEFVRQMMTLGVGRFIYTDVARDGTLTEPNFDAIEEMVKFTECNVIAAGGISSVEHLQKLSCLGVEGAIIGRAIYTGDIDLEEALAVVK
jgi:phosphoribosylformimino-5-aminoimidazole carboxamide ribotide isomerase